MAPVTDFEMRDAWQCAIRSHEKRFTPEDLVEIKKTTKPDDLLCFIKTLDVPGDKSNISKFARRIGMLGFYLETYEHSLDMITQGLPAPGCLIWGSIKVALSFVRNYTKMLEKLLEALEQMGIFLQNSGFTMDVEIFKDSPDYSHALSGFFTAFIDFWLEALKFSKQSRLNSLFRAVWSNYQADFGTLKARMERHAEAVVQCAAATGRTRIEKYHVTWRDAERRKTREKVLKFLASGRASVNEYELVYSKTYKSLHPGTCRWILQSAAFQTWTQATSKSNESMLWISAVPGAGKSFLYAFLVEHLRSIASTDSGPVLFYMFDGRNVDSSSSLSAACSLAYQLLNVAQISETLLATLDSHRAQTGQSKATDFEPLWDILSASVPQLSKFTLVLDGLDECEDRVNLVENIVKLLGDSNAKVIVLSRREADLIQRLDAFPQVKFGKTENHLDIQSFLEYEISKVDKLRDPSVQEQCLKRYDRTLVEELSKRSEGSFLLARSVLRDLSSKATTFEIIDAVNELPSGLRPYYKSILEGYNKYLDPIKRRLCCMILRWLVCAIRPLTGEELLTAVASEYLCPTLESDADADLDNTSEFNLDDKFHFSRRELEELCGPLVDVEDGLVQLAHISIADFLRDKPSDVNDKKSVHEFFVDIDDANLHLTLVCVEYLRAVLGRPAIRKEDRGRKLRLDPKNESHTFLPYSVGQWLFHLLQSGKANLDTARKRLERFLLGPDMLYWLEIWFSIEGQPLWTLQIQIKKSISWYAARQSSGLPESLIISLLCRWSRSILQLLERHGPSLQETPSEIHFIDPQSYDDLEGTDSVFAKFRAPNPPMHTPHFQLQSQLLSSSAEASDIADHRHKLNLPRYDSYPLRIFHVDIPRYVLFMAIDNKLNPELRCQSLETGQMLKPLSPIRQFSDARDIFCEGFTLSPNGGLMAMLCRSVLWQGTTAEHISYDINIWAIPHKFDFNDGSGEDWCQIVEAVSFKGSSLKPSPQPLLFDVDDTLHCPLGRLVINYPSPQLSTKEVFTAACISQIYVPKPFIGLQQVTISGDCHYMIAYKPKTSMLSKYSTRDMSIHTQVPLSTTHMTICCVSRTGNRVVWANILKDRRSYYLQDFSMASCTPLPGSEEIFVPHYGSLKFSVDENYLLGIMGDWENQKSTHIASWTFSGTEIKQTRSKAVSTITGFHFVAIDSPAYCACIDHWFQFDPLRLDSLDIQSQSSRFKSSLVKTAMSTDGESLAVLSITLQRRNLEIFDLGAENSMRRVRLQLPDGDSLSDLPKNVVFSPSLDLIFMDGVVYDIYENTEYVKPVRLPSWLPCSAVSASKGPAPKHHFSSVVADFSACSNYLSLLCVDIADLQTHPYLYIYRLGPRSSERITFVENPENIDFSKYVFALTAWHPNSPILSTMACEIDLLPQSEEVHLLWSCYSLDLDGADVRWVKAEQNFSDKLPSLQTFKTWTSDILACYSLCGAWVSIYNQRAQTQYGPWNMPREHLGRVVPYKLPRTIYPQRAVASMLWGNDTVVLGSRMVDGYFRLLISDSEALVSFRLMSERIPNYLSAVTPIVVLDNDECPYIRLVFPCIDRAPSVMVLDETWEVWCATWQKRAKEDKAKLEKSKERNSSIEDLERLESIYSMLKLRRRAYDLDEQLSLKEIS